MMPEKVLSPAKLAHVVIRTNNFDRIKRFYCQFLGAQIIHENEYIAFISYDDEHHRIGIIHMPDIKNKDFETCGLEHIAFTYDSLKDLCTAYKQRKALGIEPGWCVNHGPTTSMYYSDPDGNQVESQVDNFDVPEEATAMMNGSMYAENVLGADFDPEDLCAAIERGESEEWLKMPKDVGPRDPNLVAAKLEQVRAAPTGV